MKKILSVILFLALLIVQAYALHDANLNLPSLNPSSIYETKSLLYGVSVVNNDPNIPPVNNPIEFVILNTSGVSYLQVFNSQSWEHVNDTQQITWNKPDGIAAQGSQSFNFNSYLNKVNKDTDYTWTIVSKDSNNDLDTNTFTFTVLNDSANPSVVLDYPGDYGFVKNQSFNFLVNISDAETGIDYINTAKLNYDDNNVTSDLGGVFFSLNLNKQSDGILSSSFNPNAISNLPYYDYKIVDVYDNAGNHYSDSDTRHLYVDRDYPLVLKNFDSGFMTNNLAYPFNYNISDDSFSSISQGFIPHVDCNLYVETQENSFINSNQFRAYITPKNNTPIASDLTGKSDGIYEASLLCKDSAGFETIASSSFILDTKGPSIYSFYPENGSTIANGTIVGTFLTDDAGIDSAWYALNGVYYQFENFTGSDIIYAIDVNSWSEGYTDIIVYSNDTLNNINSETFSFIVDNTPPNISLISPTFGSFYNSTVLISYNAADNFDNALNCTTYADLIGSNAISINDSRSTLGLTSFNMGLNGHGIWGINVVCSDNAGNSHIEGTLIQVDTIAPNVTLNYPIQNKIFNYTNIEFSFNSSDEGSYINYCELYVDNSFVAQNSTEINPISPNLINYNTIDGNHNWKVRCRDLVNNIAFSTENTFLVDTIKPNITLNYNKLLLEKQLDSFITSFSLVELNKEFSSLKVKDSSSNVVGQANELQTLTLSGLNLGVGNFTFEVFANDTASNSNSRTLNFEVVDTLAPKILSTSPLNESSLASSAVSSNITLTTDENSNCRFTTNSSLTYNNMQNMDATGNRKLHSQVVSVSSGNTYNYYFACTDGVNTMNSLHYLTFSVSTPGQSNNANNAGGGGGGGGNGNNDNTITTQETVAVPESPQETTQTAPEQPTEQQTQTTNEQTANTQTASPLTGFSTFVSKFGNYKKEAAVGASVIALSLLGSYGFIRFRRFKLSKMHRPPFDGQSNISQ